MTAVLQTVALSVRAGNSWACRELDFSIHPGERWGILGVNGVGKTSLLLTLAGIRRSSSGQILLQGKAIESIPARQRALLLGVLFQDSVDPFPSTVLETAMLGRHPHLAPWAWESEADRIIVERAIRDVGLESMASRQVDTLSGGERRRLAIATLLAQDPGLMLLDEPTNHLDLQHQIGMLKLLSGRVNDSNKAFLMILHDPNLAMRFCDRVLLLFGDGRSEHGSVEEMLNEERLSLLYNHPIKAASTPLGNLFFPL